MNLVHRILDVADLSIDTRRELGLKPRRLWPWRIAHIGFLLRSHAGLFYNVETRALHNFRVPGSHIVRRPIEVSLTDADGLTIFNLHQHEYSLEIYAESGSFIANPCVTATWATELPVVFITAR